MIPKNQDELELRLGCDLRISNLFVANSRGWKSVSPGNLAWLRSASATVQDLRHLESRPENDLVVCRLPSELAISQGWSC